MDEYFCLLYCFLNITLDSTTTDIIIIDLNIANREACTNINPAFRKIVPNKFIMAGIITIEAGFYLVFVFLIELPILHA